MSIKICVMSLEFIAEICNALTCFGIDKEVAVLLVLFDAKEVQTVLKNMLKERVLVYRELRRNSPRVILAYRQKRRHHSIKYPLYRVHNRIMKS